MTTDSNETSGLQPFRLSSLPSFAGVYSIRNIHTQHVYIGESVNIIQRLRAHRSMLERECHFCKKMQEDANQYGIDSFEIFILVQGEIYENSKIRKESESQFITTLPIEKRYNSEGRNKENNGFYGKTHTLEVKQRLSLERLGQKKPELGRGIEIPPFRSRKGREHEGGKFLSIAEASAYTGMARRDIRKRLSDPNEPLWRELTSQERQNLILQRQNKENA